MRRTRLLAVALAVVAQLAVAPAARADVSETAVKAAFLPRFARYVSWPAAAMPKGSDPFVLCVIGDDPFGGVLDEAARSQSIDGRRIVVRRLESPSAADGCQIAFVDGSRGRPTGQLLAALGHRPVLTVTDSANGGQRGVVHFTMVSGRVRFFIDQAGAAQRGLTISSRLLALAVGVKQR
jgi:hypothetical protein